MRPRSAHSRGFTLIEVVISVAIVLILVAGINLIFGIAAKAVGAGQALNDNSRSNQAAQGVMSADFQNCATDDAPYIIIYNRITPAFRSVNDMRSNANFNIADTNPDTRGLTILKEDLDRNGTVGDSPGEFTSPITVNNRNHRTDIIEFFSRGRNYRHTGNPGTYVGNNYSDESLVWYGHLALPDNAGTFLTGGALKTAPGQGTFGANNNPNNVFASQWVLGRESILLTKADGVFPAEYINDSSGTAQNHLRDPANWPAGGGNPTLRPLAFSTPPVLPKTPDEATGENLIQFGRYDLADTNFDLFRKRLRTFISVNVPGTDWWTQLMADDANRFYADPFLNRPLTSAEFAKSSPIFINNCSQFIVEFAGDFLTQGTAADPDSDRVSANVPDNKIDYISKFNGAGVPPIKQIRWYGLPRNTDTSNDTAGGAYVPGARTIAGNFTADRDSRTDVIPIRDVAIGPIPQQAFEKTLLTPDGHNILNETAVQPADYENSALTGAISPNSYYRCAWGPDDVNRPSLIRITYTLDDPNGRIDQGSTFEYIFKIR